MKRFITLLATLVISCWIPSHCDAALPADSSWEVRPTNGSLLNGGCYDTGGSGTDYSQQDAAQLSLTDLTTTGAGATTVTTVLGTFTSAMVDNCLHIESSTSGFQVGFYEIVTFTDANNVILDRTPSAAAAGVAGVGKVGGAQKGIIGQTTTTLCASLAAGHIVWIKNEVWNEAVACTTSGAGGTPVIYEGYNTSRGDNPIGTNRPTNDRNAAAGDAFATGSGTDIQIKNLVTREAGDAGFATSVAPGPSYINCRATANAGEGFELTSGDFAFYMEVEADSNTGAGIGSNTTEAKHIGYSSAHDNTSNGITINGDSIAFTLVYDNAADGVLAGTNRGSSLYNNTIEGNTGAGVDGFSVTAMGSSYGHRNNIFANNGAYGLNCTTGCQNFSSDYNNYFGNATAAQNNATAGDHDVTTNPTFTDAANDDYSIGTNLKALGIPDATNTAFPLTDCYTDIGACQRQEPAGGSSTDLLGVIQ